MEENSIWHVAKGRRGDWKVLREGDATAKSRHPAKPEALQAAKEFAQVHPTARIKVHLEDNSVERSIRLDGD